MKDFCKYCFNDPVTHNCQKELCGVCEMETETAKRKMTNADRIRAMTDEELSETIKCPYPGLECLHVNDDNYPCSKCKLDWLKQEVAE